MNNKKKTIIKKICDSAKLYKQHLVGRTFLYVFEDGRYIEVMFLIRNFKHLTGVDSSLTAEEFYRKATRSELSFSQVNFTSDHPYRLAVKKLRHLDNMASAVLGELFVLEEIRTNTKTYKFGTTDMNLTLCLGDDRSVPCLVPTSLRDEDCFSRCKDAFVVTHILSKQNGEKFYSNIIFKDAKAGLLPDPVKKITRI